VKIFFALAILASIATCGQSPHAHQLQNKKKEIKMDLSKISNENIKKAIEALQANDKKAWFSYFSDEVVFTDDGRTMDFKSFFNNAFDKKEKFLDIDKVENDSNTIYGNFYAGQWGTFKFYLNSNGKFHRLDIGQAPK
jgi:Cu2+-containing amine oxidase